MNERIKELSDIAYKNHLARNPNSSFGRRTDYDREFAELIIRECISQIQELTPLKITNETHQKLVDATYMAAVNIGVAKIKEHFGVAKIKEHFGVDR